MQSILTSLSVLPLVRSIEKVHFSHTVFYLKQLQPRGPEFNARVWYLVCYIVQSGILLSIVQAWDLRSSRIWHCITGWSMPDVSRQRDGLIFQGRMTSLDIRPLMIRQLCCLEKSGTDYPVTQCHIPQDRRPRLHCCQSLQPTHAFVDSISDNAFTVVLQ